FEATVVDLLLAGFRDGASKTEFVVHERPAVRAVLLHMYLEARTQPAPRRLLRRPSRPCRCRRWRPPKSFDAWGPLVKSYNDKLLDGKPRSFPTRRLAGADTVLARIYHEHTVTKAYTPLLLGEILAARTWTSGDELNRLAVPQKETGSLHIVGGNLVATDDKKVWEPRGVMSVLDGLEAVRLAWILTTVGDEGDVNDYIAWPQPPPKAEPDQGADWTPPTPKWQRTGKGKKGQKGQKGGKKGAKGGGKGQERQRRQEEQRRDQAWDDSWWASSSWGSGYDWESPGREQGCRGEKKRTAQAESPGGAVHHRPLRLRRHRRGPLVVAKSFGRPLLAVSWEVDRACKALVQKAMPWVEHRGDLTRDSSEDVADLVLDPDTSALVVWCAAPPCQHFSRIGHGPGHHGESGKLFQDAVEFMHQLRARPRQGVLHLPTAEIKEQLHGIPIGYTSQAGARQTPASCPPAQDLNIAVAGPGLGGPAVWDFAPRPDPHRLGTSDATLPRPPPGLGAGPGGGHGPPKSVATREIVAELLVMVEEREDDTRAWLQGPIFLELLNDLGYPATTDLEEDLRLGFDMLGPVRHAPGWKPRADGRYSNPSGLDRLRQENMRTLRQPPLGDCFAALSFAICQLDENGDLKLRRGEDWRRSGHNATMRAEDVPTTSWATSWTSSWPPGARDGKFRVFGHDLQNAYRQWAVRCPGHCGTFLPTDQGVTLWFHYAMCFGAAANAHAGHFVDDFNGAEDSNTAESAHNAVAEFFEALGLQTKPSKAQAPDTAHVLQLHIGAEGVWLSPTEERRKKILAQIDEALGGIAYHPTRHPDWLVHLWLHGAGRHQAPLLRAADTAANSADALSVGLRAALSALRRLVEQSRPRLVPWPGRVQGPFPVLYADAFFLDGDLRRKPGHLEPEDHVPKDARWRNGWGFVLLLGDHVFYDFGVIKPELLQPFAARKAFIYVLEILAQVLPLVVFARRLPPHWICLHRQRRRAVRPHEGLREGPGGQWHFGLLLGAGGGAPVGA
ncbi:PUB3, partial [Symbiodinium sp. CCMP2456]